MYIKSNKIKIMKIIGYICAGIGAFEVAMSVWNLLSLVSHYRDDLETVLYAKSTPQSVTSIIFGSILLVIVFKLRGMVEDANFFSGYFEGDLDGYVTYGDLADVTGKKESKIKKQLHLLQKTCMKNFELRRVEGLEQVVLNSKKYICECKNCGAPIEKRVYFTGTCSYCGSSDLFAKVLADNRFYSIGNHVSKGVKRPAFYTAPNLQIKKILFVILLCLGLSVIVIMAAFGIDCIAKYNDEDYLGELLLSGKSYASFDLIKKDIIDSILMSVMFILALTPVAVNRAKRISYICTADTCSKFLARCKKPFVKVQELPGVSGDKTERDLVMKSVRGALKRRYLINCTFEKHGDELMVALAKQIVKDKCPTCNGPITGAVDENYRCKYCDNVIMNVIHKK